ncbi:hypothetical protein [Paenibacillus sp. CGMCC 1.18879]|uniref:hypothetical protein n=1 Tax=Paenibacillus sp. CGMCC 1.18879 TaxID=2834466 RepID=UPI001CA901D7|nr:hypothetical protein [Paenibacillus sp. CGMCC 1.18879]MBY9079572.1 hypothetical protein [Paenibacillus sp. CGMCC 1.18879]
MNIREWFGCFVQYDPSTGFNKSLDDLLEVYAEAVTRYFQIDSASGAQELIIKASGSQLTKGQTLFLNWFESKGLPAVSSLSNITQVKNEEAAVAEIVYETYILQEEMDFSYPEDVRSSLINISNELQSIINEACSAAEEFVVKETYIVVEEYLMSEPYKAPRGRTGTDSFRYFVSPQRIISRTILTESRQKNIKVKLQLTEASFFFYA